MRDGVRGAALEFCSRAQVFRLWFRREHPPLIPTLSPEGRGSRDLRQLHALHHPL
jgi:hypothetical protein